MPEGSGMTENFQPPGQMHISHASGLARLLKEAA